MNEYERIAKSDNDIKGKHSNELKSKNSTRILEDYEQLSAFTEKEYSVALREKKKLERAKTYEYGDITSTIITTENDKNKIVVFEGDVNGTLNFKSVYEVEGLEYNDIDEFKETITLLEEKGYAEDFNFKTLDGYEQSSQAVFKKYLREADRFISGSEWTSKYRERYLRSLAKGKRNRKGTSYSNGRTEAKFSTKLNSEGEQLSEGQAEYFKDSKVRDEDGNLLKVYHGTSEDFTVFDRTKGRQNMDIQGSFFSPWELDAQGYGENVKAYYLNITNPASEQMGYKALRMFRGQNNAGVKAREYLESLGYDGVNNGNEEYIAFNSNQIKLADNLNPTDNEDVRYSKKGDNEILKVRYNGQLDVDSFDEKEYNYPTLSKREYNVLYRDSMSWKASKVNEAFTRHRNGYRYICMFDEHHDFKVLAKIKTNPKYKGEIENAYTDAKRFDKRFEDAWSGLRNYANSNRSTKNGKSARGYDYYAGKEIQKEWGSNETRHSQNDSNANSREEKNSLKSDYVIDNNFAVMTRERILREIEDSSAGTNKAYARRYITTISPTDYLNLTTGTRTREFFDEKIGGDYGNKMGEYDYDSELAQNEMTPYLMIDLDNKRVIGHDGRHRMRALEKKGIDSVEIVVEFYNQYGMVKYPNGYDGVAEAIRFLNVIPQDFKYLDDDVIDAIEEEYEKGSPEYNDAVKVARIKNSINNPNTRITAVTLEDVMPLNKNYQDRILATYGEDANREAIIKYSTKLTPEEYAKQIKTLEKENSLLVEDNKYLKELVSIQGKLTKGKVLDSKSVDAVARNLVKKFNADGNSKELSALLQDYYSSIISSKELNWQDVLNGANKSAEWITSSVPLYHQLISRFELQILLTYRQVCFQPPKSPL